MAKAIITYCDVCLTDDDAYEEATTLDAVQLGSGRPRNIDLCERHRKEYVTPLEEILTRLGSPIGKTSAPVPTAARAVAAATAEASSGSDEQCPICGEVYRRTSGESHFTSKHPDLVRARVFLERGIVDTIFECDLKDGSRKCNRAYLTQQGLSMHKARSHGMPHAEQ